MGFIAQECEHYWELIDEHVEFHYEYNLTRHGIFKDLREKWFGPLDVNKMSLAQAMSRSTFVKDGIRRKWYCHKCRVIDIRIDK